MPLYSVDLNVGYVYQHRVVVDAPNRDAAAIAAAEKVKAGGNDLNAEMADWSEPEVIKVVEMEQDLPFDVDEATE